MNRVVNRIQVFQFIVNARPGGLDLLDLRRQVVEIVSLVGRQRDLIGVVEIEILLRTVIGEVRRINPDTQEERFVVFFLQLLDRPVDPDRIGCAGLSLGGEMTLYLAACDPRIKVACVACFLTSFKGTFLKEAHCTCGYVPKMARDFEHVDIASLIAPNPLMIQAGNLDPSFLVEDAMEAYTELLELYQMLDVANFVTLDVFEGGHEFHLDPVLAWFGQWFKD